MLLYNLLDIDEFENALIEKRIKETKHPIYPNLRIYEYTNSTIYDRSWDDATMKARGLIVDTNTMEVLARPFDKFFNYGEPHSPVLHPDLPAVVTDKLDGSMGILYQRPDGFWEVSTKGSFASEQAAHATQLLHLQYPDFFARIDKNLTYMFEIIYPKNRIVLDYDGMDDLVLIGARAIEDGIVFYPDEIPEWPGPTAEVFSYKTFREALEAPPRVNAEGFVVHCLEYMVKIKQEDYLKLHKIVTGLTKKRVWENLSSGMTVLDMLEIIPDEWHEWLKTTVRELTTAFSVINMTAQSDYRQLVKQLDKGYPEGWDRKLFARHATDKDWTEYPGLMFKLLDGVDIAPSVWKMIMPRGDE